MQEQRPGPPDLSAGAARIVAVNEAIVVPPGLAAVSHIDALTAGVLRPDGRMVPEAVTWRTKSIHSRRPAMPSPEAVTELPGTWLFMGELDDHIGHFLTESLARAWAVRYLDEPVEGALFIAGPDRSVELAAAPLLRALPMLGVGLPIRVITQPKRVGRLLVPTQGLGLFDLIEGSPQFRAFAWTRIGFGIAPDGPERLYISRSRLPGTMEGILAERRLEERLEAEGYAIFHPQEHSLERQVGVYRAAREVIGLDGTPFHLLAFVGDNLRKAAVICRSSAGYETMFARQLRAFLGIEALALQRLQRAWIPVEETRPRPRSDLWGELDFAALGRDLREAGLIRDASSWSALSEADVADEVSRIEASRGRALRAAPAEPRN